MEALQSIESLQGELDLSDILHGHRVAELAIKIGKRINLNHREIANLYLSALFHDVGKSMIDKAILNKPGKLNKWEKLTMDGHVKLSAIIALKMNLEQDSVRAILGHHENYDGSGYPTGVKAEDIPLGARILKICDVYDALRSDRPYRKAFTVEEALEQMVKEEHTFDPELYRHFREVINE